MSAQYRIELCSESTLKGEQYPFRLRGTKGKVGGILTSYQTRCTAHLDVEYMYTYVYKHRACMVQLVYVCVFVYIHTQAHMECMCVSKYIHIYCCCHPQGIGLSSQPLRNRPDWPLPPAGCPEVEFCMWQAASTIHHYSWIRRITPRADQEQE